MDIKKRNITRIEKQISLMNDVIAVASYFNWRKEDLQKDLNYLYNIKRRMK